MVRLLYLLFLLSGAAGLMYESTWARYLGLLVGHEAYAQVVVLMIFMGGMALGAMLVAARGDRIVDPLRGYAAVEALIGLLGLVFHSTFVAASDWAFQHAFPALSSSGATALLQWGLAAALILPQSVLLGASFPLMSAGVLRLARGTPGRVLGWLYFTNSLGAAAGALAAGFALVAWWGLPGVMAAAGSLNLLVAGATLGIARRDRATVSVDRGAAPSASAPEGRRLETVLLVAAFLTAVASFCYEVDWIRMLSLVLGSATHAFELMLSAFILGLAFGSFWIRGRIDRLRDPIGALATIQVVMGVLAVATLPVYLATFDGMVWLHEALSPTAQGYAVYTVVRYGFCLAVMLPATCCAGMTLPLITRILLVRRGSESAIGRVYGANTLGSIAGVAIAALWLMPVLGIKGLLVGAGLLDVAVGAMLLTVAGSASRRTLWPLAAGVVVVVTLLLGVDRRRLVSGVFRGIDLDHLSAWHLDYYADGRTATVSVMRAPDGTQSLATNGKVDASLSEASLRRCDPASAPRQVGGDEVTQLLLGILPLGFVADGTEAAVIGMGAGVTSHVLLASPRIARLTTIEIEPRMVDGARLFGPANRRVFDDPRSQILIGDARTVLATGPGRFDLVVSEPSNPWVSGVATLFTREFYGRVAGRLSADGLFAQWLQLYELDDLSVLRVLAALDAVFPAWQIHQVGESDIMILASVAKLPEPDWARVAALPELREDLCGLFPLDAAALDATLLADRTLLGPAVRRAGSANSDYHPRLDLVAERRRFESRDADAILDLGDHWLVQARQLMRRPAAPLSMSATPFRGIRRANAIVARTWQGRPGSDSMLAPVLGRVQHDWQRWRQGLVQGDPPPDWRSWLQDFRAVGGIRHGGTAGYVDDAFFDDAARFASERGAPPEVLVVIRYERALRAWDSRALLDAAERLAVMPGGPGDWIPLRDLVDGAVVAAFSSGESRTLEAWLERYGPKAGVAPDDYLIRIVTALAAEAVAVTSSP